MNTNHLFQVATTAVYGIIIKQSNSSSLTAEDGRHSMIKFEEEKSALRHSRRINGTPPKIQNWKSILRDATFQSLIKHTAFTPSLEDKMETDRILWDKLQAAKFLRKPTGKGEDPNEKVKMGVLLDMTTDGGSLEFRQSDRSVYKCPDSKCEEILKRLLAIWKVQRFEPNDSWIRIKVPRHNQDEDVYEYTPKHGLQQINERFSKTSNSSRNNTTPRGMKNERETKEAIIDERVFQLRSRIDSGKTSIYDVNHLNNYLNNKGQIDTAGKHNPYLSPQTVSRQIIPTRNNPRKTVFFQIQPVGPDIEPNTGFMPSVGPTGSPLTTFNYPIQLAKHFPKFTEYATEIRHDTGRRKEINFRPSRKFIQYSEPDPLYHSDMGTTMLYNQENPIKLIQELNDTAENSNEVTTLQSKPNNATEALSKLSSELEYQEETDSSINVSRFADTNGNKIHFTTKPPSKKIQVKPKNQLKSILKVSSGEVQDYAPLYAKWGEKIRTTQRPTTSTMMVPVSKGTQKTIRNITVTSLGEMSGKYDASTTKPMQSEISSTVDNTTHKTTNMILHNMTEKSPEEIVSVLTNLGVNNTSRVEGYPAVSEKTLETSSKLIEKLHRNTNSLAADPISVIVNRISQSYSYRTSDGKIKNFKKMRRRLWHR